MPAAITTVARQVPLHPTTVPNSQRPCRSADWRHMLDYCTAGIQGSERARQLPSSASPHSYTHILATMTPVCMALSRALISRVTRMPPTWRLLGSHARTHAAIRAQQHARRQRSARAGAGAGAAWLAPCGGCLVLLSHRVQDWFVQPLLLPHSTLFHLCGPNTALSR